MAARLGFVHNSDRPPQTFYLNIKSALPKAWKYGVAGGRRAITLGPMQIKMFGALFALDLRLSANQRRKKSNAIMATALERPERKTPDHDWRTAIVSQGRNGRVAVIVLYQRLVDAPGLAGLAPVPHARNWRVPNAPRQLSRRPRRAATTASKGRIRRAVPS
jgi:hypothetical protein